jgi:hypothetical protein
MFSQIPTVGIEEDGNVRDGCVALRRQSLPIGKKDFGHDSIAGGTSAGGGLPRSDAPAIAAAHGVDCADACRIAVKRSGLRRIAPRNELFAQHHTYN